MAGCTVEAPLGSDVPVQYEIVVDTPAELRDQLDLLFVVDNSENMEARQRQLAISFQSVFRQLNFGRGMPDLHIGVVSTDMGIGEFGGTVPSCSQNGDAGRLGPMAQACGVEGDAFLAVKSDVDGERLANFDDELDEAFSCMTQLGESGCEYEQPLEAMRTVIDEDTLTRNGFLRPDAVLGVVMLTDEDDCSAYNPEIFNPESPEFRDGDPNFRCFQSGVICQGDDVYKPGLRADCHPRTESEYITNVSEYVDYMKELKPDPRDRVLSAIIGDPGSVSVEVNMDGLDAQLVASCEDSMGEAAYPGVRLAAFVDNFQEQGERSSLCNEGPQHGLDTMVRKLRQSMGTTCLAGDITDIDPDTAGRQVGCRVYEQLAENTELRTAIPRCDNPANLANSSIVPCYSILTGGEACGDFRTQLALQVHGRTEEPGPGTRLIAECRVNHSAE
jgi:hypothetical protein